MNSVFITAIICLTITALAWMYYDLKRRRIIAADKRAKTRTIEKEVVVDVPVYQGSAAGLPDRREQAERPKRKGSVKGYYCGKNGEVTFMGGEGRNGETE